MSCPDWGRAWPGGRTLLRHIGLAAETGVTQRTVTLVMAATAALAFVFSFGNVWALALRLGVPRPIAPLIAPMVDLSVIGLLVGLRHLPMKGIPAKELQSASRLMHASDLLTLGLNVAEPIMAGHYGRAALDAVAPVLLLGWGSVGPTMLRQLHTAAVSTSVTESATVTAPAAVDTAPTLPKPTPRSSTPEPPLAKATPGGQENVLEPLLKAAHSLNASRDEPLSAAQFAKRLGVALPVAEVIHAQLSA